jgi:hypothetical protein
LTAAFAASLISPPSYTPLSQLRATSCTPPPPVIELSAHTALPGLVQNRAEARRALAELRVRRRAVREAGAVAAEGRVSAADVEEAARHNHHLRSVRRLVAAVPLDAATGLVIRR